MTTITFEDNIIEAKYTKEELKKMFLFFMQTEMKEDSLELYQISIDELPGGVKESYYNIDNINFIKR